MISPCAVKVCLLVGSTYDTATIYVSNVLLSVNLFALTFKMPFVTVSLVVSAVGLPEPTCLVQVTVTPLAKVPTYCPLFSVTVIKDSLPYQIEGTSQRLLVPQFGVNEPWSGLYITLNGKLDFGYTDNCPTSVTSTIEILP